MSRRRINLNREWEFFRGDVEGAERIDFDDSNWQPIGLPHCFDLPYFRTPEFYVGAGWYRKYFNLRDGLTPSLSTIREGREEGQKRVFVEFDGVFQVAEIFVNGLRAGEHRGGYTGLSIDITEFLDRDENLLAVRVNNNWNPQLAPRAGEHIFCGGIYRDVYLTIVDSLHITWNGILVTTPQVSSDRAALHVSAEICNCAERARSVMVINRVFSSTGRAVAGEGSAVELAAGETRSVAQTMAIDRPDLWHPSHPSMYRISTVLLDLDAQREIDELNTFLGFRWFEWTPDRGFFLNGEHLYPRGANAHQDHAGWGIGVTRSAVERDVKLIKDAGFNFVRGSHYPHHPAFAEACDRLGLLFMPENCLWGKGGFGPEGYWNASAYPVNSQDFEPFEAHCKQTLREMILTNRNHPSIIAWSMCNEPFFTYNLNRAKNLLRDLVKLSHEIDSTRPAAIGGAQRGEIDKIGDIACYNGDGARLFIDPGVPNMVSEYGAIYKPPDGFEPFLGELQQDRFPWRAGEAIWCAFDYGTIAGKQGLKGIVDHARLPKQSWHWYRKANLNIDPPPAPREGIASRLRLSAEKTTIEGTDAIDDCQIVVTVCDADGTHVSNSPPVTLTIESGPGEFPTGPSITLETSLGHAAIAFRSYHAGNTLIRATSPGLKDATITITTTGSPSWESAGLPLAPSRPYVAPEPSEASTKAMRNQVNVALNRPCRASSESEDHPARLANDGNVASFWSPSSTDSRPFWQVDLEGFYQLSSSRMLFANEAARRYLIEVSRDGSNWEIASDKMRQDNPSKVREDVFPPGAVARYIRITFDNVVSVCEVEIFGLISTK